MSVGDLRIEFRARNQTPAAVVISAPGPTGPPGPAGAAFPVELSFTNATTVNLVHNFAYMYPDVDVINTAGARVYPAIDYALNTATITFPSPVSGVAIARR